MSTSTRRMKLPALEPIDHQFPEAMFGSTSEVLHDLGKGNDPVAIMITCSELGFEPDYLSRAKPGEVVVIQTVGGLVCNGDQRVNPTVSFGTLLNSPRLKHLIVCGHSNCKVFDLLLQRSERPNLLVCETLESVNARFRKCYAKRPSAEHRQILIQESVLQQLAYILTRCDVEARLRDDSIRLHAWIRDDSTSTVASFDARTGQFTG